jgi:hypothetical protein
MSDKKDLNKVWHEDQGYMPKPLSNKVEKGYEPQPLQSQIKPPQGGTGESEKKS